ncbi:archease [Euryarchaeota archaeon ex4484_162]|nr:MAG: archease [Euryarchaeota archaeon ex4484_162]RLF62236.1 MAG: archease [Thermoplasmata archaeon]
MRKYEIIEHTADVGIRAWGSTMMESFENTARGMFAIITNNSKIDHVGEYKIVLKADSVEQLLVDWLNELLFLNTTQNLVFGDFNVELSNNYKHLKAIVGGEEYNREKHGYGTEIKAVTYHMLKVEKKPPYTIEVLFDI